MRFQRSAKLLSALCVTLLVATLMPISFSTPNAARAPSIQTAIVHAQSIATPPGVNANNNLGCGSNGLNVSICLSDIVYYVAVAVPSWLLSVAAIFMGAVIKLSLSSPIYALSFISTGWTVMRDVANMSFIFILIYLAFTIMLQAETGGTLVTLGLVILMALLVNFSFFLTRVVVDAGNIAAVEVYNAIPVSPGAGTSAGQTSQSLLTSMGAKDLSAPIMGTLDLQGLFSSQSFTQWYQDSKGFGGGLNVLITLSCLYIAIGVIAIILAFGFLTAGAQFLTRIVMLWFAIVLSPLAFVAWAVPKWKPYYKKWLSLLITNTLYPAAFLFIFLFLIVFMDGVQQAQGSNGTLIQTIFTNMGGQGTANNFLYALISSIVILAVELGLVIATLKFALSTSERFSTTGAEFAHRFSNWAGARFGQAVSAEGSLTAAGMGFIGRSTVGWAGDTFARSSTGRKWRSAGGPARILTRAAEQIGGASFDVRGTRAAKAVEHGYRLAGEAGGGTLPVNFGKPSTSTYRKEFDARVKAREEEAAKTKPSAGDLEKAQEKAVANLEKTDPAKAQELADAADTYDKVQKDQKAGAATPAEVKAARKLFNDKAKSVLDEAKKISGADNPNTYADSIIKRSWGNLGGIASGRISLQADKEAARKIRGRENDAERLLHMLKDRGVLPSSSTPPSPPPSAPTPPTPPGPGRRGGGLYFPGKPPGGPMGGGPAGKTPPAPKSSATESIPPFPHEQTAHADASSDHTIESTMTEPEKSPLSRPPGGPMGGGPAGTRPISPRPLNEAEVNRLGELVREMKLTRSTLSKGLSEIGEASAATGKSIGELGHTLKSGLEEREPPRQQPPATPPPAPSSPKPADRPWSTAASETDEGSEHKK